MECLPLVMEPESGFYAEPVVVLDFQSLYPSMIIAYNLCYSTCLGKVVPSKPNTLGVSSFSPDPHVLLDLKDQILLTPNGVMYVPTKVILLNCLPSLNISSPAHILYFEHLTDRIFRVLASLKEGII